MKDASDGSAADGSMNVDQAAPSSHGDADGSNANAVDVGPQTEVLSTGEDLALALLQLGDGTGIDPVGPVSALATDSGVDLGNVAAAIDDLGGVLDILAPRLDALISEVNLFEIDVSGDSLGDA